MRRLVILLFPSLLWLGACGPKPWDCASTHVFCVGLVTNLGPVTDGINHEAWLGLQDAKAQHWVDRIDAIETVDSRDRALNISTLAQDGYDVIVTVDSSMSDQTIMAAQKYPKLYFIGVEQPQDHPIPNLAGLVFHEERSGYLAGALAARMTQSGRVAAVCDAKSIDAIRRYCDGFEAGVRHTDAHVHVSINYHKSTSKNDSNDPAWGSKTALEQVNDGADVIFAAGGATADAALKTAAANGAYIIGAETDQYARFTESSPFGMDLRPRLLSSAANGIRHGVLDLIMQARSGKFPSGEFMGEVALAPFHDSDRLIPPTVKAELSEVANELADGTIRLDIPYKSPASAVPQKPLIPATATPTR